LYDGNTLDELYPTKKILPKMWWMDVTPKDLPGVKK